MKKLKIITTILSISAISLTAYIYCTEATCSGGKNCNACSNCKYCKNCSKDGGTCSVCK